MYKNKNKLYNLSIEELKIILKEYRKYKNNNNNKNLNFYIMEENNIKRKYYWRVWNILNEKYNMGEI